MAVLNLPDPDRCRGCGRKARVVQVEKCRGYTRRRHACRACSVRWNTYQTRLHPKRITFRKP